MKYLLPLGVLVLIVCVQSKVNLKNIKSIGNIKEYKKVLKTHKNVLTLYSKDDKSALSLLRWMEDVAKDVKGKGTIVYINCGDTKDAKKLCKKYSVSPKPKSLKHYKDGEFNKDYDRKDTAKSMLNFMLDPTGDAPWEEDPAAKNVVQVSSEKELVKLRRKEKGPLLIMFYAPWCGYCKKLKPDYAAAATDLKGKAVLAGMDVDKPDAFNVRYQFNITGFPTLLYFENGEQKFNYGGKMDKEGLIAWMKDPKPAANTKEDEEEPWSAQAPEILHLTDATFDEGLKEHPSIVIMFYAPWCGHCKSMKPEYVEAAKQMVEEEIAGKLGAVDCTKEKVVCKKFDVSGYPTVNYFNNAEFKFKLSLRKKDKIIEFMKNPEEPPPPPPEDLPWAEVSSPEVLHLSDATFKDELKKKKHVLVMFYAPWCGHCKKAKPEIETASAHYKDDRKVWYAGVDCTVDRKTCEQFDVSGYPTFRYFQYGKKDFKYEGGRTSDAFIKFMEDPKESTNQANDDEEPQWKDSPSGVVHLGDNDFDDFVKSHPSLLVMFYAPWCGHCKSMKPAYTEAANELLGTEHSIAAVDCTKNRKVASTYSISGYPTLKYFKDGEASDYNSGRSKDSIINFLTEKTASEPAKKVLSGWAAEGNFVNHLDADNFDSHLAEENSVLVMFYAPWCGHCKRMKPAYADASVIVNHEKKVQGSLAAVDCTENSALCGKYGIRGYPTIKYFKTGENAVDYSGGRTSEDFVSFLIDPKRPAPKPKTVDWSAEKTDIAFLTPDTFEEFVTKEKSVLVMFYAPWCGHCKKMKPAFAAAASVVNVGEAMTGKLAAVDCVQHPGLGSKYDVSGYPTLKYFKDGKEEFKYRGPRTEEAFLEFMKKPSETHVPRKTAQKSWADETGGNVVHLTDANFDEFVKDKEVLVAFYAPWCGACSSMKTAYFETAKKLKEDEFPAVIAAIDATEHRQVAGRQNLKGYPTLKYFSNGKFVEDFEQQRTVTNFYAFLRKQIEGRERSGNNNIDTEKWEDLPSSVTHLNKETYQDYLDKTEHALVVYHIRWCKHCNTMRSNVMQAASRLAGEEKFGIAAVNCDSHPDLCDKSGVTAHPTIKYFMKGSFVENYSAATNPDDVVAFLQSKRKEEL